MINVVAQDGFIYITMAESAKQILGITLQLTMKELNEINDKVAEEINREFLDAEIASSKRVAEMYKIIEDSAVTTDTIRQWADESAYFASRPLRDEDAEPCDDYDAYNEWVRYNERNER